MTESPEEAIARYARERAEREATARDRLSELLQPEWRSVRADYEGGGDQGDVTAVYVSKDVVDDDDISELEAGWRPAEGEGWLALEEVRDRHERIGDKWELVVVEKTEAQTWANEVIEHVWPLVARKWGGFAFEGNVTGLIVFDAVTKLVIRQDSVSRTEYETETETF